MATTKTTRPAEILVIGSKMKAFVQEAGMRCDSKLVEAASDKLRELLVAAVGRARDSKRGTVRPSDL